MKNERNLFMPDSNRNQTFELASRARSWLSKESERRHGKPLQPFLYITKPLRH